MSPSAALPIRSVVAVVKRRCSGVDIGNLVLTEDGWLVARITPPVVFQDFVNSRGENLVGRFWEGKLSRAVLRGVPASADHYWMGMGRHWFLEILRGPSTTETGPESVTPGGLGTAVKVGRVVLQKSGLVVFCWDLEEAAFGAPEWKALEKARERHCGLSLQMMIPEGVTASYSALYGMVGRLLAGVAR